MLQGKQTLVPTEDGFSGKGSGDDQAILREHEAALQRLEELQQEMIGGEKAGVFLLYSRVLFPR